MTIDFDEEKWRTVSENLLKSAYNSNEEEPMHEYRGWTLFEFRRRQLKNYTTPRMCWLAQRVKNTNLKSIPDLMGMVRIVSRHSSGVGYYRIPTKQRVLVAAAEANMDVQKVADAWEEAKEYFDKIPR